ncbi:hypothetical protein MRB53_040563 [Persea americana]|nr:hypothetical protein MRB53_040563 [Persea americana]
MTGAKTRSYRDIAAEKRSSLLSLIPREWHISVPSPSAQLNVTGEYIEQYLTSAEKSITQTDAVGIADRIASREWTAVDVIRAFCHPRGSRASTHKLPARDILRRSA